MTLTSTVPAAPAGELGRSRLAVLMLSAAVLFGMCNVAWRFGDGSVAAMAATRAAAGLILFAPMVVKVSRSGAFLRVARDPAAIAACALSGGTLWAAALMFRTIPGSVAAATIGVLPVVTLLVGRMVGSRRTPRRSVAAMCVATAAALVAAGPVVPRWTLVIPVLLFLSAEGASLLVAESARRRHDASTLVVGGLVLGAIPAPFLWAGDGLAVSGLAAALAVALLGTTGRLLRGHAQGSVSAAVAGSATQVTALVTAIGGVILFTDELTTTRLTALLLGAVAATLAIWWSAPAARHASADVQPTRAQD